MTKSFYTGTGKIIELGKELGKGGEGSVFEVPGQIHWAAKLYNMHHAPDATKQAKLRFMVQAADSELVSFAAWPQETLHTSPNGPVVGFLMPKISGRAPIHTLYSPAHRRQEYPTAAWDFLLFAARNTAAAFDAIHRHGHVLGDVNQGNVLVGLDSKVVLIDSDSFQINANGTMHLCKVGVAHFTPPELQGVASFDRVARTCNHDNFGLALLIFHILLGGRHPYSGVPLRADVGEALEKDIQSYRYAYASDGPQRGFNVPPKSIPITLLPHPIQAMFTLAFTENGAKYGRPTAQQWLTALDGLRGQVKRCPSTAMHIYPGHLSHCPWCALEGHGIIYFLDVQIGATFSGTAGFTLERIWAAIEAIPVPPAIPIPDLATLAVVPNPLPPGIKQEGTIFFLRMLVLIFALGFIAAFPPAWFIFLGLGWWAWSAAGGVGGANRNAERSKRQIALNAAQQQYDLIIARIQSQANPESFHGKKQLLTRYREEYKQLPERERTEIANLHATAEARQKHKFLERHFIDSANIPGVGATKKTALRSYGIETAADVTWNKVIEVRGFGDVLTRAVVDWRKACERRFVFNPHQAVSEADKNAVKAQIANRRRTLENALNTGLGDLQQLRQELNNKIKVLSPLLQEASQKLAQARADLNNI